MDNLESQVRQWIAEILKLPFDEVRPEDDFVMLGAASLAVIELSSRIHAELGVELALDEIFEATSVSAIVTAVEAEAAYVSKN